MSDGATCPFEEAWTLAVPAPREPREEVRREGECDRTFEQHEDDPWFPPTDPGRRERSRELGGVP